ncbi:hypothetical protein [Actinocrispum wychmicini]|uniref:Holin n=1 Tax=Actinocrispum wychmicini TaxID=1213861 RepID=A0A4R2J675_9PSEU|nr:hypothetical protein [Actinocrispum wychmicini]TCO52992.1 hypothetical protein EV192_111186 [Actinocrispum wychmicini]
MTPDGFIRPIRDIIVLLAGLSAVVILALSGEIHDGETIAALSAVLSTALGTRAVDKHVSNSEKT